ncbi:MAG: hypothetical protein WC749_07675 [Dehalococcoidia bacterium]
MPVKVTVQGVSKKASNGDYKEYDFSTEIDEDLTEQEIVNIVLKEAGGHGLYRKSGQNDDRIQIEYIGAQRDEPMMRLQARDSSGRFTGYDALGRQLWSLEGKANTQPRDAKGHFMSFAQYAKSRGVSFATGEVSTRIKTTSGDLQGQLAREFTNTYWKEARPGNYWRKEGVQRVRSPYKQLELEED